MSMEKHYKNGRVEIRVDGRHIDLVFFPKRGPTVRRHLEPASSAELTALIAADRGKKFDPDSLSGNWGPPVRSSCYI